MSETTPTTAVVTIGLDVHKSSIRMAAVTGGQVLTARTLPHDHSQVDAALAEFPLARSCTSTDCSPQLP